MGEDKCKEPREKMEKEYKEYREARDTSNSIEKEVAELGITADEDCAVKNFKGKKGDALKYAVNKCVFSEGRYSAESAEWVDARGDAREAYDEFRAAQKALRKCEHKKKSGR